MIGYSSRVSILIVPSMYVCPKCKGPLHDLHCERCDVRYPADHGIPCFMAGGARSSDQALRDLYDDIYRQHTDVWVDQGRSGPFQEYFAELVGSIPHEHVLEIGCGEGILLAALPGTHKYGIDPSAHALVRAQRRSNAHCAVARCEVLPFPAESFDVAVAVGVMEHFEMVDAATAEIERVLAPSGHYIVLIQTDMTCSQRLAVKVREFLFPRFRPMALIKWLQKKLLHRIVQPLRKSYTLDSARDCLQHSGLKVTRVITRATEPDAPLGGPHVVVLVARKQPP